MGPISARLEPKPQSFFDIGPDPPRFDEFRPGIVQTRADLEWRCADLDQSWPGISKSWVDFDLTWPESGQSRSQCAYHRPELSRGIGPKVAAVPSDLARARPNLGPQRLNSNNFGPEATEVGPESTSIGPNPLKLARLRPQLAPVFWNSGQTLTDSGKTLGAPCEDWFSW